MSLSAIATNAKAAANLVKRLISPLTTSSLWLVAAPTTLATCKRFAASAISGKNTTLTPDLSVASASELEYLTPTGLLLALGLLEIR